MSVALLLITHGDIGMAIHNAAITVIGSSTLRTSILPIHNTDERDEVLQTARTIIQDLDTGSGVLVLTDMFGSTPSNIACLVQSHNVAVVSGLNLPMLIRILNYPSANLTELVEKAISAGVEGIIQCKTEEPHRVAPGS